MCLSILLIVLAHAFHLSTSEINYDHKSKSIQISTRIFIDDLESELKVNGFTNLHIGTQKETANADSIVFEYIMQNLIIKIDDEVKDNFFVGKELSEELDAVWAYVEIPLSERRTQVSVYNSILTKLFDDQRNMVVIKVDNKMVEHEILDFDTRNVIVEL